MRICISGAGVAGPCLAHWLLTSGHEVTLVEKSPHFRTGGYVIDFWGLGYTIAERMGVLRAVLDAGYKFREVRFVGEDGRKISGLKTELFHRMTNDRFVSLPRGDLAAAIYSTIEEKAETVFGDMIAGIEESPAAVKVAFEHGAERSFDLLVGADGLHSQVRKLCFGAEDAYEKDLGYRVATFRAKGYRPRDELAYVTHATPGRQIARVALRNDETTFLFVFRSELMQAAEPRNLAEKKQALRRVFAGSGWESDRILDASDAADDIYFDCVSQIRMPRWSKGRIALVGDASAAVSLLAGEGTGLGMTEAYVLAGELKRSGGDYAAAFAAYEGRLRKFIEGKQEAAEAFAASFTPKTAFGVWFRNQATRAMRLPVIADWLVGKSVRDNFDLPDYGM